MAILSVPVSAPAPEVACCCTRFHLSTCRPVAPPAPCPLVRCTLRKQPRLHPARHSLTLLHSALSACAAFCAAEAAWSSSFLLSCGRVAAAYLQSIWFLAAARIIFEGRCTLIFSILARVMIFPILEEACPAISGNSRICGFERDFAAAQRRFYQKPPLPRHFPVGLGPKLPFSPAGKVQWFPKLPNSHRNKVPLYTCGTSAGLSVPTGPNEHRLATAADTC